MRKRIGASYFPNLAVTLPTELLQVVGQYRARADIQLDGASSFSFGRQDTFTEFTRVVKPETSREFHRNFTPTTSLSEILCMQRRKVHV
jgi:hypothetical protein